MFTSLRFLCFGNTPLPSLNSPRGTQSIDSTPSPLCINDETTIQHTSKPLDGHDLTLSSSIGPYPIPSSLMREVESIRAHILQQKSRHQKHQSRRHGHKQKSRRQRLQQTAPRSTTPETHHEKKPAAISYHDVSSPYAGDTSVFELNVTGEPDGDGYIAPSHHNNDDLSPEFGYLVPEEQLWNPEVDSGAYLELDDLISQAYLEAYDNLDVYNPSQSPEVDELYSISKEVEVQQTHKHSDGDTGWWLVKHIDPKALSRLGNDCVIL